jgi:hypothetical protein
MRSSDQLIAKSNSSISNSSQTNEQNIQIAGKGHNVMLEFANPLVHTMAATDASDGHVPENGDTCVAQDFN